FASARTESWDTELISDVYLVPAAGGEPRRLTHGDGGYRRPGLAAPRARRLTHGDGGYGAPVWSPDGTQIVAGLTPDTWVWGKHTQIAVIDVETGEHRLRGGSPPPEGGAVPHPR